MLKLLVGATAALALGGAAFAAAPTTVMIDGQKVFNESMTATKGGDLIIGGSGTGAIYRAKAGAAKATVWIDGTKMGVKSFLGVFAHDASNTLYACSVSPFGGPPEPALNKLLTFNLKTGAPKGSYPMPAGPALCNDVALNKAGDVFIADTVGAKVLKLKKGGTAIETFAASKDLAGADGIAFLDNGDLIVNTVTTGRLFKINPAGAITELTPSMKLGGADGMRSSGGNRFLMAESGAARITEVTVNGDKAEMRVVHSDPGVTGVALVGKTVWVNNGKVNYMMDPKLKGQDPGQFSVYSVPLGR